MSRMVPSLSLMPARNGRQPAVADFALYESAGNRSVARTFIVSIQIATRMGGIEGATAIVVVAERTSVEL